MEKRYRKSELEAMPEHDLHETYAEVVGGGLYEKGEFTHLVLRDFSIMNTPREREVLIAEILAGRCKWANLEKEAK